MNIVEKAACAVGLVFVVFSLYAVFVWFPVALYNESECLRQGYPESRVSIGLSRYCMNLDGSVMVKVDKQ